MLLSPRVLQKAPFSRGFPRARFENLDFMVCDARALDFSGEFDVVVSFNALHIMGSLGTTNLTPLQDMYAAAPTMGIADGVDEVHKATVARNVLKSYRPHEGNWPTEYFPAKREAARKKFEPLLAQDPELRDLADGYAKYMASRH